nr:reverse transcriptase domain-containing protein [Tanacetum cinerariifolium]
MPQISIFRCDPIWGCYRLVSRAKVIENQVPRSPEYVPDPIELEDHVPLHIPKHPEDLVPAKDEAYILKVTFAPTPSLPPSFLSLRIRPLHTRAAMAQMRAAVPSTYHSLLPSGTPPLLPIPLPVPSTSHRAEIPEADTPPRKRLLLTAPRLGCEIGESSAAAARQPGPTTAQMVNMRVSYYVDVRSRESSEFYSRPNDAQEDRAAVRAEIEVLRRERLAYEQESIQIHKALTKSEAYSRTLEARVAVLETQTHHHEWQRKTADDFAVQHIMRTQALEVEAHIDILEDTGTEGVVGLTQWFKKMKFVFNISNCTAACQVKYAGCTLQGVALTWWNSHMKTVTLEVAQALTWKTLKKMMTDKVKATRPKTMQEAIEFASELMDRKIRTFAERQTKNKRKQDDNNNQAQQQPLKKQCVAIAYTAGPSERNEYAGTLPLCNKCKFHHNGQCTIKCINCNRVGHLTRDCRSPAATNNHRNPTCY